MGRVEDAKKIVQNGHLYLEVIYSIGSQTEFNISSLKVYNGQEDKEDANQEQLLNSWLQLV
jgi:hypothetical protein